MRDTETWFLAICQDCQPILPQPFRDASKRDEWAQAHNGGTGHNVMRADETRTLIKDSDA